MRSRRLAAATARGLVLALFGSVASAAAAAELVVEWAPLPGEIEGYQVERRVDAPLESFKPIARVASSAARFTDGSVTPGVRYCYRVRGIRGDRISPPSPPLCNLAPEAPAPEVAADPPAPLVVEAAPAPRGEDREVKALRRPPPKFPSGARVRGLSGWVKLIFTVSADGTTRDIRVTASDPPEIFDEAAIEAAQRFLYAPRLENGVAVDRPHVETELTFTWIDSGGRVVNGYGPEAPR